MSNIFHNKTIAIIGSAPHLLDIYQPDLINSYDLVVRFNTALPLDGQIKIMTGNRCDILYMGIMQDTIYYSKELLQLRQLRVNPDFYTNDKYKKEFRKYENKIGKNKVKKISQQWGSGLINLLDGTFPNTGLSAMCEILDNNPKRVYLTGFTFWQQGCYYPGYRDKEFSEEVGKVNGNYGIHRQDPQIKYFMKFIYPSVEVDTVLQNLVINGFQQNSNSCSD